MATALVTGATSGIGASFVHLLAERGNALVLVARDTDRMTALADELRAKHQIDVEILRADLSVRPDVDAVAARLEDAEHPIDILVNNAGFALHQSLLIEDTSLHERAFDVMIKAVFLLGGAAARAMKARGHGLIVNTGSSGALLPSGNYAAIKAWTNTYSESLSNELHGTGVHVVSLEPGWVRTEFHERGGVKANSLPEFVWAKADDVARETLDAADAGRVTVVPTVGWKVASFLAGHVAPRSVTRLVARALNKSRR